MYEDRYRETSEGRDAGWKAVDLLVLVVLTLCVIAAFKGMLAGYFVSDDFVLLATASSEHSVWSILTSNWLLQKDVGGFYRPVVLGSWILNWVSSGLAPKSYYLTNLLLHLANSFLMYLLLVRLGYKRTVSGAAASLFAAHPVHTEAVAWISGRTDLVAALFYLLAGILFAAAQRRQVKTGLLTLLAIVSFIVALGSKEIALTFPGIALVIVLMVTPRQVERFQRVVVTVLGSALILGGYLLVRFLVLGGLGGYGAAKHLRFDGVILNYLRFYLGWMMSPLAVGGREGWQWSIVFIAIALGFCLLLVYERYRFAVLWTVITMVPVLNLCRPQYLYLPSVGVTLVIALFIVREHDQWRSIVLSAVLICSLLGFYILETRVRVGEWVHTGGVARGTGRILKSLYAEFPADAVLYFANLPINRQIPIGVFQNGIQEAIQLWYGNQSLTAKTFSRDCLPDPLPPNGYFFEFVGDRFSEITNHLRGELATRIRIDLADSVIKLSSDHPRETLTLPAPIPADAIEIWSVSANSSDQSQGFILGELETETAAGLKSHFPIRLGFETADWAYDRPDVRKIITQSKPPVAYSTMSDTMAVDCYPQHVFKGWFPFDQTRDVSQITIKFHKSPETLIRGTLFEIRDIFIIQKEGLEIEPTSEDTTDFSQF